MYHMFTYIKKYDISYYADTYADVYVFIYIYLRIYTLPETHIALENRCLEDETSFWYGLFSRARLVSGSGIYIYIPLA